MTAVLDQVPASALTPSEVKLVYFDIDGTLLDRDGGLPASVCTAIARLHDRGVDTAFATGRPSFATATLQAQLRLTAPGVYYTGAQCGLVRHGRYESIVEHTLAKAQLQALIDSASRADVYCEIYYRDCFYVQRESDISREHARHLQVSPKVAASVDWPDEPIYKLLLGVDLRLQPEGLAALESSFSDFHFAYAHLPSRPSWQFASVVAGAVNKPQLFAQLLAYHNLQAAQVMALGDGHSDMDFLRAAGIGIAMGNADERVKAVANYVTRASWEDGVAYALARFFN